MTRQIYPWHGRDASGKVEMPVTRADAASRQFCMCVWCMLLLAMARDTGDVPVSRANMALAGSEEQRGEERRGEGGGQKVSGSGRARCQVVSTRHGWLHAGGGAAFLSSLRVLCNARACSIDAACSCMLCMHGCAVLAQEMGCPVECRENTLSLWSSSLVRWCLRLRLR